MERERNAAVQLVSQTTQLAGSEIVAAYIHGSLASDDFMPGLSDLDVLVIVEEPVPEDSVGSLVEAAADAGRSARTNVDLHLVTHDVAGRLDQAPNLELGISVRLGRAPESFVEARREVEIDLLNEFSICRQQSEALMGPDASEVLFDVPPQWVAEIGAVYLERWQEIPFEPRYADLMVFTACRVWRFADDGKHMTKTAAARWAIERRPDLEAPKASLEHRSGVTRDAPGEIAVRELLGVVLNEVRS